MSNYLETDGGTSYPDNFRSGYNSEEWLKRLGEIEDCYVEQIGKSGIPGAWQVSKIASIPQFVQRELARRVNTIPIEPAKGIFVLAHMGQVRTATRLNSYYRKRYPGYSRTVLVPFERLDHKQDWSYMPVGDELLRLPTEELRALADSREFFNPQAAVMSASALYLKEGDSAVPSILEILNIFGVSDKLSMVDFLRGNS